MTWLVATSMEPCRAGWPTYLGYFGMQRHWEIQKQMIVTAAFVFAVLVNIGVSFRRSRCEIAYIVKILPSPFVASGLRGDLNRVFPFGGLSTTLRRVP